jgi:hypothetical protein
MTDNERYDLDDWEIFDPGCDCTMCTLQDTAPPQRSAEIILLRPRAPTRAPTLDKHERMIVTLCFMGCGSSEIVAALKARGIDDGGGIIYAWNPAAFRSATVQEAARAAQSGTWFYRKFPTRRALDHFMWRHPDVASELSVMTGNYPDPPEQLTIPEL